MPIRITGMNSGLDTESIITALTSKHQTKLDNFKGDQKKLTWKQDKWKELNKKVTAFFNGSLSTMRFSSAYTKKTTTSSNANAVTVVTGENAMDATQQLSVTRLAKSAYLTGEAVEKSGGGKATGSSKMEELGLSGGGTLKFKIGGDSEDILEVNVEASDSIEKVVSKLRNATSSKTGTSLNFNFDDANGRFYVASKGTGDSNSFEVESTDAMNALGLKVNAAGTNYIAGSSAAITLNGVEYTSDSNTFNINGLTITANEVAQDITLTTKQDTSGIYDNIKKLVKDYSDLMKEFSTLYNADKASKYKMLTDDEKDAMSDKEVEEWEDKIKAGLLSKDETIGTVKDALRSITNMSFDVKMKDGTTKALSLASFGITTGSYFSTEENEREVLHIDGDADDALVSNNTDLLRAAISADPESVQGFFTSFAREMYSKVSKLMEGTEYSSSFTIYEDKLMASQYSAYNNKISDAQKALEAAQDRYYTKFAAMEKALAKINSSSSSLGGMFGSN